MGSLTQTSLAVLDVKGATVKDGSGATKKRKEATRPGTKVNRQNVNKQNLQSQERIGVLSRPDISSLCRVPMGIVDY